MNHGVSEVAWPIIGSDARRVPMNDAKVPSFPGNLFTQADEARGSTRNGTLPGMRQRADMEIQVTGEVEATVGSGLDERFRDDTDATRSHCVNRIVPMKRVA